MTSRSRLSGTSLPGRTEFESATVPTVPRTPGINKVGSTWRSGTGVPDPSLGVVTDWYLDKANGDLYEKTGNSTWTKQFNFSLLDTAVATALHITRAQIPAVPVLLPRFTISGNTTPGDLGSGATYKLGTSSGPRAIQDVLGTWFELDLSDGRGKLGWFGCVGDGVTDDTSAAQLALTALAGKTVEIEAATFAVTTITVPANTLLTGGNNNRAHVLKRKANTVGNGPVISVAAPDVVLFGFTIDGNKANQTYGSSNVQTFGAGNTRIERVYSHSAKSVSGYGSGFSINSSTDAANETLTVVVGCEAKNNDGPGLLSMRDWNVHVLDGAYTYNGSGGILISGPFFPPEAFSDCYCIVRGNHVHHNIGVGIGVGNYTVGGSMSAPIYGIEVPQSRGPIIEGNNVHSNSSYGIAYQGECGSVVGNVATSNGSPEIPYAAGILFNGSYSTCSGNTMNDNYCYGMDAGGSVHSVISGNQINNTGLSSGVVGIGINLGCSRSTLCDGNSISNIVNGTGIAMPGLDGDGITPFAWIGFNTKISNNRITFNGAGIGIWVFRDFQSAVLTDNYVTGTPTPYAFAVEGASIRGNRAFNAGNVEASTVTAATTVIIPDHAEVFYVTGGTTITNIITESQNTFAGKVRDVRMSNFGSGYNPNSKPSVTFTGGGGTGAAATAEVDNGGRLVGVSMTNHGSGYTSAPTVSFGGPGTGAAGIALINCNNFAERVISLLFTEACTVNSGGNLFLKGSTLAADGVTVLTLRGAYGNWIEVSRGLKS